LLLALLALFEAFSGLESVFAAGCGSAFALDSALAVLSDAAAFVSAGLASVFESVLLSPADESAGLSPSAPFL
jgi:hypothetical protein